MRLPYRLVCTLLGLALGWVPWFFHGPVPEKFSELIAPDPVTGSWMHVRGPITVWAFYLARMSIGFWVGNTSWPARWYLRGPAVGFLVMLPVSLVPLSVPLCGFECMFWNLVTGSVIGAAVAALAFLWTGKPHA